MKTADSRVEEMLSSISPNTHPAHDATHFRTIFAAVENVENAQRALREAVAAARADGESWTVIGAALGTTRQNAQQRFGG